MGKPEANHKKTAEYQIGFKKKENAQHITDPEIDVQGIKRYQAPNQEKYRSCKN